MDAETGQMLLAQVKKMTASKRGIDRRVFLIGEYAILATNHLKLRNVITRDDDLKYFDEIIHALKRMQEQKIGVVPILGYCYEENSADGEGYIFQQRAKGQEMYDDAMLAPYQVWTQNRPEGAYLSTNKSPSESAAYIATRTREISLVPQEHFDKLISDMLCVLNENILIDCFGKSNFFYDAVEGFQLIDLDSHDDYKYGLTQEKPDIEIIAAICAFVPCHYAVGTKRFAPCALDEGAIAKIGKENLRVLQEANPIIFEKCRLALENNGIPRDKMNQIIREIKVYGD